MTHRASRVARAGAALMAAGLASLALAACGDSTTSTPSVTAGGVH
jgi:hypothetical protein